jgi:hypothetical protein
VRSVAVWRIFGLLALAKPDFLLFLNFKDYRIKFTPAVRPVAEGLIGTFSTRAPEILARFKIDLCWHFCSN